MFILNGGWIFGRLCEFVVVGVWFVYENNGIELLEFKGLI